MIMKMMKMKSIIIKITIIFNALEVRTMMVLIIFFDRCWDCFFLNVQVVYNGFVWRNLDSNFHNYYNLNYEYNKISITKILVYFKGI